MKYKSLNEGEAFFKEVISTLNKGNAKYLVAGTYAFRALTGINRKTKDLDLFCKASDYTRFIQLLKIAGFKVEITDARWLAKVHKGRSYVDLIFASNNQSVIIDDTWFENAKNAILFGEKIKLPPVEEFIWEKSYIQTHDGYGGTDINHLILKYGKELDWKRLLQRMEAHWELLFAHIINFRFVYPSERTLIPKWLIKELLRRFEEQLSMPKPKDKITRGTMLSGTEYETDVKEWGFQSGSVIRR
jgi:hypothetical protein